MPISRPTPGIDQLDFGMIGDSTFDTLAGKAAGAPVVVLSFGYNDMPPAEMDADAVIDDFAELIPALEII